MNGKKNGKVKEYNEEGKIQFEGEYIKGEKNGKGKEFDKNGHLKFEGEFLEGRRWNGKEYAYYIGTTAEYTNGRRRPIHYLCSII